MPRLILRLIGGRVFPLSRKTWGKTLLMLPGDAPREWQNVLTGSHITPSGLGMGKALPMAQILSEFPVGLLESSGR